MKKRVLAKKIASLFLCLTFLFQLLPLQALAEGDTRVGIVTGNNVNVRVGPGTEHSTIGVKVHTNQAVTVHGEAVNDSTGNPWYSVSFELEGVAYSGYIIAQYIRMQENPTPPVIPDVPVEENKTFEEELASFPESYHAALRAIHEAHPSWHFVAFQTNLDFNEVLANQNYFGRSLINDGILSHYSTEQGYDWETDEYSVLEGKNWYQAAPGVVAYYLDPRNFLNENDLFQFEKLTFNAASQTEEAIASMMKGSFMDGKTTLGPDGTLISYAKAFLYAATQWQISPFHLVTRCIQEVGWNGNGCSKGTYSGYEGYYNFFNIGARTGAADGMKYAAEHGWDSAFKAIYYGAEFIGNSYIARGQDTPYFQKFSVVDPKYYYSHQYMTNIAAAQSEGKLQRKEYVELGILETPFTFRIPVYLNMPEAPCPMPAATGSPNNYLKSLSVDGYELTPTFDFYESLRNGVNSYTIIINGDVSQVFVRAQAAGKAATVTGQVGAVPIWTGENYISLNCTAASGAVRQYTVRVILNGKGSDGDPPPPPAEGIPSGWAPPYSIQGNIISGIAVGTDASAFITSLGVFGNAYAILSDENGHVVSSGAVRSGLKLTYYDGANTTVFELAIRGDVNRDSAIDAIDLLVIRKHLLGLTSLDSLSAVCADINRDGAIDAVDLLMVRKHLLGLSSITQ